MIETKFRGKRIDNNPYNNNGEWVYGGILTTVLGKKCNRIDIVNFDSDYLSFCNIQVDEKTCGQYTGFNDKKGKEIYDGDIIRCDIPLRNIFDSEYADTVKKEGLNIDLSNDYILWCNVKWSGYLFITNYFRRL